MNPRNGKDRDVSPTHATSACEVGADVVGLRGKGKREHAPAISPHTRARRDPVLDQAERPSSGPQLPTAHAVEVKPIRFQ